MKGNFAVICGDPVHWYVLILKEEMRSICWERKMVDEIKDKDKTNWRMIFERRRKVFLFHRKGERAKHDW